MNLNSDIRKSLWAKQQISSNDVDYGLWNQKKELLKQMAEISHSCLFTVDVFKNSYDFASSGFSNLFGYKQKWLDSIEKSDDFFENMTHPEDLDTIIKMQIDHAQFIYNLEPEKRNDYSNTYKFRMLNSQNKYLNVMSQQRVIQQDINGKAWIILGEVNILPDQNTRKNVQKMTVNLKTGQIIYNTNQLNNKTPLSNREIEILKQVHSGYLSKEIAAKLCISLNTVNNHRKNILKKLQVENSIEAINEASKRGII